MTDIPGWEKGCGHPQVTLEGDHVACVDCGQHELFLEISSEDLAHLLQFVQQVQETLLQVGMTDTARQLRQKAGELVVHKRLVWKLPVPKEEADGQPT